MASSQQRWKWLLLPLSLPLIYLLFILSSQQSHGMTDRAGSSWFGDMKLEDYKSPLPDTIELNTPLQKQIPCGLLFTKQSEHVQPLKTVLVDSTAETSTITRKALQEYGLKEIVSAGGVWIPAGSLWLRIDEATVPAPAIKIVQEEEEDDNNGKALDYSLKLGMDFLRENRAKVEEEELYIRVEGKGDYVLLPYIMPRGIPLETLNTAADSIPKPSGGHGGGSPQQLVMRKQIPCGIILPSGGSAAVENATPDVLPLKTVIDSTVASSMITRKAVDAMGLSELVQSNHDNQIIAPESFSLRMDDATVPSPLLRVVDEDSDSEYALMLGMFFLRENEAVMRDGDLYIVQPDSNEEVLVPFIEARASLSFDGANEEL